MKRLYFLWDYDFTEKDVKKMLKSGDPFTKHWLHWLVGRILESAKYDDVWKYLNIKDILKIFPKLLLKKPVKQAWETAFKAWGY